MVPRPPVSRVPIANPRRPIPKKFQLPSFLPPDREDICQGFIPDLVVSQRQPGIRHRAQGGAHPRPASCRHPRDVPRRIRNAL